MRFIADNQIPTAIGRLKLLLHIFVTGELVEPGDYQVGLQEPVAGPKGAASSLSLVRISKGRWKRR